MNLMRIDGRQHDAKISLYPGYMEVINFYFEFFVVD